ncbi:calmodulin-like [Littorina saxatilis]|uniref:EF-hand domain-containing protein n=1 Tax=Littorina saxatilis TaxID=31220 RepID=A0AAN9BEI2_9CAEN
MASSIPAAELEEYRAVFKVFDKDGSGSISAEELEAVLKAQGVQLSADQAKDLIKKYDKNGDGDVDFDEFTQLITESEVARAARFAMVFKTLDTDGDGNVSAAELRAALQNRGQDITSDQIQAMLNTADTDGNGQLSFEEFLKFVTTE